MEPSQIPDVSRVINMTCTIQHYGVSFPNEMKKRERKKGKVNWDEKKRGFKHTFVVM